MNKKSTILIIDDAESSRGALRRTLKDLFFTYELDNCNEAVQFIQEHQPIDLILLGLNIPGKSGMDFLAKLKGNEQFHTIPVIACTGEDDEKTEEAALALGAEDILLKPFNPAVVRNRVINTIKRELRLEEANTRTRAIFNNLPGGDSIFDVDEKGMITHSIVMNQLINALPGGIAIYKIGEKIETIYSSEGIPRLSGRTMEEYEDWVKGDIFANTVYVDDIPKMTSKLNESLPKGKPINISYRLKHKNGSLVWVQLSASKIREEDGCQIYYAVYTKTSDEAALYQNVVEDSSVAVFVAEKRDRKALYANKAWKDTMGIDEKEVVIGRKASEIFSKKQLLISDEEIENLPWDSYRDIRRRSENGKYLRILARSVNWNGIDSYVCYFSDETEVQNNRRYLQELLDKIPGGVGIYEMAHGKISLNYLNDAYFTIIGAKREERQQYMGTSSLNAVHEEDREMVYQAAKELENGRDTMDVHYRVLCGNGEYKWLRLNAAVVDRDEYKCLIYACYSDFEQVMNTQQELLGNRKMLDVALDTAKVLVWKYDPYKKRIVDTGTMGEAYGLPRELDNVPECFIESGMLDKASEQVFRELFEKMPCKEQISADIYILNQNRTQYIWERIIFTPMFDETGRVTEEIGSSIDITEQKQIKQRYEYELQMRNELLSDSIIFYQVNVTRKEIEERRFLSPTMEKYPEPVKFTQESWLQAVHRFVAEDYQQECIDTFQMESLLDSFAKGITSVSISHMHLTEEVTDRWCSAETTLMKRPGTEDIIALVYIRDVDAAYKKQMAFDNIINEETELISLLSVDTGIAHVLRKNKDCYFTPSWEDYMFDEVAKGGGDRKIVEEDREECLHFFNTRNLQNHLKDAEDVTWSFSCMQPDHKIHRKKVRAFYLDKTRKDIIIIRRDITDIFEEEQKRAVQLKDALNLAQTANRSKSEFLSRVSHDMRTPLNGILGLTELMKEKNDWSQIQKDLEQMEMSGRYLLNLINDTLDVSRIENNQMELHPIVCDGKTVLENTLGLLRPNLEAKNIKLSIHAKDLPYTTLYMDVGRTEQLIMNIMSNAIKFTPSGGNIEFSMENISENETEIIDRVTVRDNGIGMSEEFIPHLFEPFSQENTDRTSKYQGTGLGMTITRQIVELMGGTISARSKKAEGTEISFTICLKKATPKQIEEWHNEAGAETNLECLKGKRVLLCEDHPLNTQIAVRLLKKEGMSIDTAENGQEGIEKFAASEVGHYDIILMDIRMPLMDGLEAAKRIRAMERQDAATVPIVAMTANALSNDIEETKQAGMNAHISKPVEPSIMYSTIAATLSLT